MTRTTWMARRQGGYVLLIVMVLTAMGMAAALAAFGLAEASGRIAAADAVAERALFAARAGVLDAADRLVWGGLPGLWAGDTVGSFVAAPGDSCSASVVVRRVTTGAAGTSTFEVTARGASGDAAATVHSTLAVRPLGLPRGITVAGDLRAEAALSVSGCGLYAGGDVYGREHVDFCRALEDVPGADGALPHVWPTAAVHAAGRIYAAGAEIHQEGMAEDGDTDACTGEATGQDAWPPSAEVRDLLTAHAVEDVFASTDGTVDLAGLATRLRAHAVVAPQTGSIVVVTSSQEPVVIEGWWPQSKDYPQVTLVVVGDAVIAGGGEDAGVAVRGALMVTGRLRVLTPSLVVGHVAAGRLEVSAPLSVVLPSDWCEEPPPGSLTTRGITAGTAAIEPGMVRDHAAQRVARRRSGVADGEGKTHVGAQCPNDACGCYRRLRPTLSGRAGVPDVQDRRAGVLSEVATMGIVP